MIELFHGKWKEKVNLKMKAEDDVPHFTSIMGYQQAGVGWFSQK